MIVFKCDACKKIREDLNDRCDKNADEHNRHYHLQNPKFEGDFLRLHICGECNFKYVKFLGKIGYKVE